MQTTMKFNSRGDNAKKASRILRDNKKEYQRILKAEIASQKGKKDVCKAAKAAAKKHKKMSWKQAMKQASK
ncbi:MAG: hypothetical protein IKU01_02490 [Bacteroidales bacterium]|nr:hypothetical protein [Bacteroidales bacterium]